MKKLLIFVILTLALSACGPVIGQQDGDASMNTPVSNDPNAPVSSDEDTPNVEPIYAPKPEDANWTRGNAYVKSVDLIIRESYPMQFALQIEGELPTPCNQLRVVVAEPDANNRIDVEVYSVIEPGKICIQTVAPFSEVVNLGSYPSGHYTIFINDKQVSEFDA